MQRVVVTPFIDQFQLYILVWLIEALDCSTSTYNVFLGLHIQRYNYDYMKMIWIHICSLAINDNKNDCG